MAADLEALAARLLDAAKAAGAEAADAIAVAGDSLSIEVRNGALEQAERAEGVDLGLRVLIGRRQACVSSSDIRDGDDRRDGRARGRDGPRGAGGPLVRAGRAGGAGARLGRRRRSIFEDPAPMPAPAELQAAALAAEAAALAVPGVSKMDAAGAGWSASRIASRRHATASPAAMRRTGHSLQAVAICGEGTGMERDYAFESRAHRADLPDPAEVGRLAGRARRRRAPAPASRRPAPSRCSTTSGSPPG